MKSFFVCRTSPVLYRGVDTPPRDAHAHTRHAHAYTLAHMRMQGEAGNIWEPLHYALYGTGAHYFDPAHNVVP